MRPGARGAVLLDAAQRSYEPGLAAKGTVLARVSGEIAFTRTNGEIDADPAVLVAGEVISRRTPPRQTTVDSQLSATNQER